MKNLLSYFGLLTICLTGCADKERTALQLSASTRPANLTCGRLAFEVEFQNCIQHITFYHLGTRYESDVNGAFHCLSVITGVKSYWEHGDVSGYPPENGDFYYYLNKDLNNWYDWYDAHPDYTLDSAVAALRRAYPWQPSDSTRMGPIWKRHVDTTYWPSRINTRFYTP
jgi:hypothetical protein